MIRPCGRAVSKVFKKVIVILAEAVLLKKGREYMNKVNIGIPESEFRWWNVANDNKYIHFKPTEILTYVNNSDKKKYITIYDFWKKWEEGKIFDENKP
jgi:hypothetical protein